MAGEPCNNYTYKSDKCGEQQCPRSVDLAVLLSCASLASAHRVPAGAYAQVVGFSKRVAGY